MNKKISAILAATMATAMMALPASAKEGAVNVTVDGVPVVWTDAAPFIDENNRTMVPLSAVAEVMGLEVEWVPSDDMPYADFKKEWTLETSPNTWDKSGDGVHDSYVSFQSVSFYIGMCEMSTFTDTEEYEEPNTSGWDYNGASGSVAAWTIDTAAIIRDGRTYAPIRYLAENFYYDVNWNEKTNTVELVSTKGVRYDAAFNIDEEGGGHWFSVYNITNVTSAEITKVEMRTERYETLPTSVGTYDRYEYQEVPFSPIPEAELSGLLEGENATGAMGITFHHTFHEDAEKAASIYVEIVKENGKVEELRIDVPEWIYR